ncbi:hypothetical protein V6948_15665, partial [Fusobacterium varium]|uniref:hypothetical protein n=1 Tax=Fusobacterium varium TaxID=856 RepID=UPI002FF03E46
LAIFMIVGNIGYGESLIEEKEEIYMDKIDNNAESDGDINMSGDIGVEVGKGDIVGIKGNNITITGNNGNGVHTISQEIFSEPPSTIIIEGNGEVKITGQKIGVNIVNSKGEISGNNIEIIGHRVEGTVSEGLQVSGNSKIAINGRETVKITAGTTGVYFSESSGTISGKNIDITGIDYNGIIIYSSDITISGDEKISIKGGDNGIRLDKSIGKILGENIKLIGEKMNGVSLGDGAEITINGTESLDISAGWSGLYFSNSKGDISSKVINIVGGTNGAYFENPTKETSIQGDDITITGKKYNGIYLDGNGSLYLEGRNAYIKGGTNGIWNNGHNQGKITIKSDVINLSGETEDGILVHRKGNIVEIEGKNTIISGYRNGIGALYGGKAEINSTNTIILGKEYSIYADSENNNVKSEIILSENGSHEIYGNIKSSRNSSIKIGGKGNKISSSSNNEPLKVTAEDGG